MAATETAVLEPPVADTPAPPSNGRDERALAAASALPAPAEEKRKKGKKKDDDDLEYEVEFATPFGKIEFEFEPTDKKEKKDRERKAKAEKDAARVAAKAAKLAEKQGKREAKTGGGHGWLVAFVIFGIIAAAVVIAIWLFARPGEDDAIPAEYLDPDAVPEPEPQGFVARTRARVTDAVRSGRSASREAQDEQRRKFEEATGR